MVDVRQFTGSYFAAKDVESAPIVLTITGCTLDKIVSLQGEADERLVLTFAESPKKLVLKKSIIDQLVADFGSPETDDWVGQKIELYSVQTQFAGRQVPGLRARKYDGGGDA